MVFSSDGRRSLIRSELPISALSSVAAVEGVADAGALGVLLATAAAGADSFDIAVMGHLPGHAGEPKSLVEGRRPELGEPFVGLADISLRAEGISLGDWVTLTGSSHPVEVVGFVKDARYMLADTLWVPLETWKELRFEVRPETIGLGFVAQAFPILVDEGADVEAVAAAVDRALATTETVTTNQAVLALPGVQQQQSTFTAIIVVSFVVVGLVIGLFFALITLEKRGQLAIFEGDRLLQPIPLAGGLGPGPHRHGGGLRPGYRAVPVPGSHPSINGPGGVSAEHRAIPVPRDRRDGRSRRDVLVPSDRPHRPRVRYWR